MKRLTVFRILVVTILVFGCVSTTYAEKIVIDAWHWSSSMAKLYQQFADQYMLENPNVEIKVTVPSPYIDKVWVALASDSPPVLFGWHADLWGMVNEIKAFTAPFPDDFLPGNWVDGFFGGPEEKQFYGDVYYLPIGWQSGLIWYHQDLWNENGFGAPPKTWDDLRNIAKKATRTDGQNLLVAGFDFYGDIQTLWWDIFYQMGGHILGDSPEQPTGLIGPIGVHSLDVIKQFMDSGVGDPAKKVRLWNKNTLMVFKWSWYRGSLKPYPDLSYKTFNLPQPASTSLGISGRSNWENSLSVASGAPAQKKEEAFKFLAYCVQHDFGLALIDNMGILPGEKRFRSHPLIANDPMMRQVAVGVDNGIFPGPLPLWVRNLRSQVQKEMIDGTKDPRSILAGHEVELKALAKDDPPNAALEKTFYHMILNR